MTITITIRKNGPYVIAPEQVDEVRLVDHEGNVIPPRSAAGKPMSLCRCGGSAVKPFCDGTHSKIGFIGAEAARAAYDASVNAPAVTATTEFPVTGIPDVAGAGAHPHAASASPAASASAASVVANAAATESAAPATPDGPVAQGDGAEAGPLPPTVPER